MSKEPKNAGELATGTPAVTLPEGVTQDQVDAWKQKHGKDNLRLIKLSRDEGRTDTVTVVARVPDRTVVAEYLRYADSNITKANSILIENCLLTGKDQVRENDRLYFSALAELASLIPISQAETVKL